MNILYKYSSALGAEKILDSLKLKLPIISEVNDPLDCSPTFFFGNDMLKIEARFNKVCKSKNIPRPSNIKEFLTDDFKKSLINSSKEVQDAWKNKGCLLSVSANEKNTAMWAHYADDHKGVVIGFDFEIIMANGAALVMDPVIYSAHRLEIDVFDLDNLEKIDEIIMTKSSNWAYEKEFRTTCLIDGAWRDSLDLVNLEKSGLASLDDFNGKKTWFLRLNPLSIKKVIFGLHTGEDSKLAIKN